MKTLTLACFFLFSFLMNFAFAWELPNDPKVALQWEIQNSGSKDATGRLGRIGADMNVARLWSEGYTGSRKIKVAIVDTGVDIEHEDLKENIFTNEGEIPDNGIDDDHNGLIDDIHGWNFSEPNTIGNGDVQDVFNHGTHVAGIIGAKGNNGIGVAGINWNVSLIPIRYTNDQGGATVEAAIRAINYAVLMKADIINCSWGMAVESKELHDAFMRASDQGILIVASAGNSAVNNDKMPIVPAAYTDISNLVSVAATDNTDELAFFSNFGLKSVALAAPGFAIMSTLKDSSYGYLSGTSMSAPSVTGVAALLMAHLGLSAKEVKERLIKTSDPVRHFYNMISSHGRVNAYQAMHDIVPEPINVPSDDAWVVANVPAIESGHPYSNNLDQRFRIYVPKARFIRLIFDYVETEPDTDVVQVEDMSGKVYQSMSGFTYNRMSDFIEGDSIYLRFVSDDQLNARGFRVKQVEVVY